jgi:hypothetical protein
VIASALGGTISAATVIDTPAGRSLALELEY